MRTERMHLPRDSTEIWLESQTPKHVETTHLNPPQDLLEAWIEKRIEEGRAKKRAKGVASLD